VTNLTNKPRFLASFHIFECLLLLNIFINSANNTITRKILGEIKTRLL